MERSTENSVTVNTQQWKEETVMQQRGDSDNMTQRKVIRREGRMIDGLQTAQERQHKRDSARKTLS